MKRERIYIKKSRARRYIWRGALVLLTAVLLTVAAAAAAIGLIAYGPSPAMRNTLVLSAMQASATRWIPPLFLGEAGVTRILDAGAEGRGESIRIEDYTAAYRDPDRPNSGAGEDSGESGDSTDSEWQGGLCLKVLRYPDFCAYMLLVRDPSRVYVGTSSSFVDTSVEGVDIFTVAKKEGCIAAINGGEFYDPGGVGSGNTPTGLTFSCGTCVWDMATSKSFVGFDSNNTLHAYTSMTRKRAEELGIRDGVCFQTTATESVLIVREGEYVKVNRYDSNTARAQRTAIGQRADGTVILLVTDGRTAASPGATYNDVTDIMVRYGAVCAAMLDGGSSSMLYYDAFYERYPDLFDPATLDKYGKRGLVNKYKAYTQPRQIPTFFCVSPER